MTDQTMTHEQALEWLEGLRNATGDQVCAEIEAGKAAEAAQAFRAALSRPAVPEGWKLVPVQPTEVMKAAGCRALGAIYGHYGAEQCWKAMLAAAPEPAEESLTTEQPEDGLAGWRPAATHRPRYGQRVFLRRSGVVQIAAPTFDGGDDGDFWDFFGIDSAEVDWESDEWMPIDDLGNCLDAVKAERDALRAESAELRERVKELEADAARWHFVRQFMRLDDVGDEDFCLGLITYEESLSERVDPAAQRLYKDRWDARCRAEYQGEELDQGEITVDEAIDAAMQENGNGH